MNAEFAANLSEKCKPNLERFSGHFQIKSEYSMTETMRLLRFVALSGQRLVLGVPSEEVLTHLILLGYKITDKGIEW